MHENRDGMKIKEEEMKNGKRIRCRMSLEGNKCGKRYMKPRQKKKISKW